MTNTENYIIKWKCYEPAGHSLNLTEADLTQHVLIVGSTGCGKTTLLTSAVRQLLAVDANDAQAKVGLLILDGKVDGLVEQVLQDARAVGRESDVQVFGPNGNYAFDLFDINSLAEVEEVARRIMRCADPIGGDNNAYWQLATSTMVTAALTLAFSSGRKINFETVVAYMRKWFLSPTTPVEVTQTVHSINKGIHSDHHSLLAAAVDQVMHWQNLESRTRSNIQSCLINVLRVFSGSADRCFSSKFRPKGSPAAAASEGKVAIISLPALAEAELARFFFKLAKEEFINCVHRRQGAGHRLAGMIADEFPLVVIRDDVEHLGVVRSKRCFVLAATQGLDSLTQRLGIIGGRAVVNHFNTTILMRVREVETATYAFLALGNRKEPVRSSRREGTSPYGGVAWLQPGRKNSYTEVPICPVGALSRLAPHQAFVLLPNGERTEFPIWFCPWFEEPGAVVPVSEKYHPHFSNMHVANLMRLSGYEQCTQPRVVAAAAELLDRRRDITLEAVTSFFRSQCCMVPKGLEALPTCWLAGLPGILSRMKKTHWSHLPFFIDQVRMDEGMLLLNFAQEQPRAETRLTAWDRIRITINSSVYPSVWRPLSQRHSKALSQQHPEFKLQFNQNSPSPE